MPYRWFEGGCNAAEIWHMTCTLSSIFTHLSKSRSHTSEASRLYLMVGVSFIFPSYQSPLTTALISRQHILYTLSPSKIETACCSSLVPQRERDLLAHQLSVGNNVAGGLCQNISPYRATQRGGFSCRRGCFQDVHLAEDEKGWGRWIRLGGGTWATACLRR